MRIFSNDRHERELKDLKDAEKKREKK